MLSKRKCQTPVPKISAILLKAVPSREKQQMKAKEAIRSNQRIY